MLVLRMILPTGVTRESLSELYVEPSTLRKSGAFTYIERNLNILNRLPLYPIRSAL